MRRFAAVALVFLAMPSLARGAERDWRSDAARDLDAIHAALVADHPGAVVDRDSTLYRAWVGEGYELAKRRLPAVTDVSSYAALLRGYVGGFRDDHVTLWPTGQQSVVRGWPGFATRWNGGEYVVVPSPRDDDAPEPGARLARCDGVSPAALAAARLDVFQGNLELESDRFATAYALLWDLGNPYVPPLPHACEWRTHEGVETYDVRERPLDEERRRAVVRAASTTVVRTAEVRPWNDKRHWWIGLPPSFTAGDAWDRVFADVQTQRDALRNADVLVFDVRGTVGGSSSLGYRLARIVWGDEIVSAYRPSLGDAVWRVSRDNRRFVETVRARIPPADAREAAHYDELLREFDDAGRATFVERFPRGTAPSAKPPNPVKGKVFVLTDYTCVSACLDFMDLALALPNVRQAGLVTGADSIFMEAARMPLPSGSFLLDVPHKAWTARPRGTNVPYAPAGALTYRGDPSDDAAERAWLWSVVR